MLEKLYISKPVVRKLYLSNRIYEIEFKKSTSTLFPQQ